MSRIVQSIIGGALIVLVLACVVGLANDAAAFILLMWPMFILQPLFPSTELDPLFPAIPNVIGLLVSLIMSGSAYSALAYALLSLAKGRR
jgi:hypothetical protein